MNIIDETGIPEVLEITNEEQARNWVKALLADMQAWRDICNVRVPDNNEEMVRQQQRALWKYLQKQGKVIGALQTLLLTRQINELAYKELTQKALNSLAPTVVGSV